MWHHVSISLMPFKSSHSYTASNLTTDRVTNRNKKHNYFPDCHPSGLHCHLTSQTWGTCLYPWKSQDHKTPQSACGLVRPPVPTPAQGRLSQGIKLCCSGLYSQVMKILKEVDSPASTACLAELLWHPPVLLSWHRNRSPGCYWFEVHLNLKKASVPQCRLHFGK